MTYEALTPDDLAPFDHGGASRKLVLQIVPGAIVIALSAIMGTWMLYGRTAPTLGLGDQQAEPAPSTPSADARDGGLMSKAPHGRVLPGLRAKVAAKTAAPMSPTTYGARIDPTFSLPHAPRPFVPSFPMSADFAAAAKPVQLVVAAVEPSHAMPTLAAMADLAPAAVPEASTPDVPMPTPRPRFIQGRATAPSQATSNQATLSNAPTPGPVHRRLAPQGLQSSAPPVASAAEPSFFDRLFGGARDTKPQGTALAYATPQDASLGSGPLRHNPPTARVPTHDPHTAIYDISAHIVYLPDGTQLEAHSGFGDQLDDPRAVTEKMSGPTPPAFYGLTLRESLFHGVQALRLTPISGNTFGRTGLLAHRFMMGPRGDSNGCVSVRNYDAFLQAYTSGQIRHLVVVASLH